MKRYFWSLVILTALVFSLTSCFGDDDDTVVYDDAGLASFSISGTVKMYFTVKNAEGRDSTYKKYLSTANRYAFYIDQRQRLIYNPDSLPYNCDLSKVLVSVSAHNGGVIAFKSMTSDSLYTYNSSDSIDFTQPRYIYVYSNSGRGYRAYKVTMNKHQEQGDVFNWHQLGVATPLMSLQSMRGVAVGTRIYVFGSDGQTTQVLTTADGQSWAQLTTNHSFTDTAWQGVVAKGDKLFVCDEDSIWSSTDGAQWTAVSKVSLARLVGASDKRLYAYASDGQMMMSVDDGVTWVSSPLNGDASLLPTQDISCVNRPLSTNANTTQLVLIGNRSETAYPNDNVSMVWGKIDEYGEYSEEQAWTYYDISSDNNYKAPRLTGLQAVGYGGSIVAFGGKGLGSTPQTAYGQFYNSGDGGITWRNDTIISPPEDVNIDGGPFALIADSENYLWLICGKSGQVWRGRTNMLGWRKEQVEFKETN